MAYTFEQIFAADPASPGNVASNGVVTIFAPGDTTKTPLPLTTVEGLTLNNPIVVNAQGFGPAFIAPIDRVAWEGAGYTGFLTSYDGMKEEAVAARTAANGAQAAAEEAARSAGAPAQQAVVTVLTTEGPAKNAIEQIVRDGAEGLSLKPDNGGKPVGKGELVVNILDCGAVGDGVTDDSAAFVEALRRLDSPDNHARELYLPPLTYNVLSRIKLISNLVIRGYGATILKANTSKGYVVFYTGSNGAKGYGSGDSNIKVSGLRFLGNFASGAVICGFSLHHSDNVLIEDCTFEQANNLAHCVDLGGCTNIEINRCQFLGFKSGADNYAQTEVIQLDISAAGAASATDAPGSWDGLPCRNVTVQNCKFLPITVGGTAYPAPNPLGSHAKHEGRVHRNIKFLNNQVVEPSVDTTSELRGVLHFIGVENLTIEGNEFEFRNAATTATIGLYATTKGAPAAGANYEAGGVNTTTTIAPLKCSNVTIRNNTFRGFGNTAVMGPIRIEPLDAGTTESKDIRIHGNSFEVLNVSNAATNFITASYVDGLTIGEMNVFTGPGRPLDGKFVRDMVIGNNRATGSRASAFRMANCSGVKISGLNVAECAGAAIYIADTSRVALGPNGLHSLAESAVMKLTGVQGFTVKQQDINAPAGLRGIEVYGSSTNGVLSDNLISGGTTAHIQITAGLTNVTEKDNLKLATL